MQTYCLPKHQGATVNISFFKSPMTAFIHWLWLTTMTVLSQMYRKTSTVTAAVIWFVIYCTGDYSRLEQTHLCSLDSLVWVILQGLQESTICIHRQATPVICETNHQWRLLFTCMRVWPLNVSPLPCTARMNRPCRRTSKWNLNHLSIDYLNFKDYFGCAGRQLLRKIVESNRGFTTCLDWSSSWLELSSPLGEECYAWLLEFVVGLTAPAQEDFHIFTGNLEKSVGALVHLFIFFAWIMVIAKIGNGRRVLCLMNVKVYFTPAVASLKRGR